MLDKNLIHTKILYYFSKYFFIRDLNRYIYKYIMIN